MKVSMNCEICHKSTGCLQLFNNTVYTCNDCYRKETMRYDKKYGKYSRWNHEQSTIWSGNIFTEEDLFKLMRAFHVDFK